MSPQALAFYYTRVLLAAAILQKLRSLLSAAITALHRYLCSVFLHITYIHWLSRPLLRSLSLWWKLSSGICLQENLENDDCSMVKEGMQDGEPKKCQSNGQVTDAQNREGSILLPRMPLGLRLVSGKVLYAALAGICRTLGRLAAHQGIFLVRNSPSLLLCDMTPWMALHPSEWQECRVIRSITVIASFSCRTSISAPCVYAAPLECKVLHRLWKPALTTMLTKSWSCRRDRTAESS